MRIAVISDTHVPSRAASIPEWVREEMAASDHVIHAGDFDSPAAYESVVDASPALTAVAGNMDPASIDVPEVATLDAGGVRFVVVHGTGDLDGYDDRVVAAVDDHAVDDRPTVGISGHTHQRRDVEMGGYRLLNPGSATGADPAPETSMLVVEVADGEIAVEPRVE
ncbi:metallophosphoesterase family protein [Halorarius halobius]|uniref:metallophosphoesterase family protein n=1 Tax=Halorarius halobius TaxID=2962671 RepID=UPI0020CD0471|nr:metallophosphoesterase family protein [Halorarius halobius]